MAKMRRLYCVFVVLRHCRDGRDKRIAVIDDKGPESKQAAMAMAQRVADEAARDYGYGSTSVYRGMITLTGRALKPKAGEGTTP